MDVKTFIWIFWSHSSSTIIDVAIYLSLPVIITSKGKKFNDDNKI